MTKKYIQIKSEYNLITDIFQAYYDARKNKRNSNSALAFEIEYEKNLVELCDEISNREYNPAPHSAFIIEKPVKREVFASCFRDRVVHHLIFNYINPIFDPTFINDSYSCRVGRGTLYGIKRVNYFIKSSSNNYKTDTYILKLDIQGYFMSINKLLLFEIIKKQLIKKQHKLNCSLDLILFLVEKVIFRDPTIDCIVKSQRQAWQGLPRSKSLFFSGDGKGLPIGNLTSQLFANIYLNELDQYIKRDLKVKYYGRYVDDMVLVGNDKSELLALIAKISDYLAQNLALNLHPKKIYLQHHNKGVNFLGVYIKPYRMLPGKRLKRNFYNKVGEYLMIWMATEPDAKPDNAKIFFTDFNQTANSYFAALNQIDAYVERKAMVEIVVEVAQGIIRCGGDFAFLYVNRRRLH